MPELRDGRSRFAPPETIARDEPYCLFLDELNASSPEVQKAFYSLILDRRIGAYELPAGLDRDRRRQPGHRQRARPADGVRAGQPADPRPPAGQRRRLAGLGGRRRHPPVDRRLPHASARTTCGSARRRPRRSFSTPRSWHMLSDALHSYGDGIGEETLRLLAARHAQPDATRRRSRRTSRSCATGTASTRSSGATPRWPHRAEPTATCSTSWPRRSGPGWSRTCRPASSTRRRRCGSSPTGPRRCWSSWPRSRWSAPSW